MYLIHQMNFFTNLCYEYDFPTDKDIALQDRIKIFFSNISLCDTGCTISNINLENKTSNCQCSFKDTITDKNNNNIEKIENALIDNLVGKELGYFDTSNIAVIKCAKKAFKSIKKSKGIYITLSLLSITIICSIIYFFYGFKKLMLYIYENTEKYLNFIENSSKINNSPPLKKLKKSNYEQNNENGKIHKKIVKKKRKRKK